VADLAGELRAEQGDALGDLDPEERRARITDWSFRRMLAGIRKTLARLGVEFDVWFSERTLHETGAIAETVDDLRERGVVEDRDGAIWLRTTMFGDDKDRPLIRSNGAPTYFGADAAYYRDKRRRGFDRLLFLWGADHHGYVPRMRAVVRAFGDPDDTAEFLISQLVSLVRAGQPARMSKRAGDIATVDDLLDEVGKDAFRYTMLRFSLDAPIEFDVEAVTRQSLDNPVYYVQYAYARISSVLRQGTETGFTALPVEQADLGLLDHPMEAALLRRLAAFEEQVIMAAVQRAPHRLTRYAEELAAAFHRFYAECRVLGDDHALSSARWWLVKATGQVLANTLALIGVHAPERM
jgi:arginyl-tRNA synthetase